MVAPAVEVYVRPTPVGDVPAAELAEGAADAGPTNTSPSWRMIALRVGATLVVITLVTLAIRRMDLAALRGALDSAGLASLVVASLFSLTMLVAKAAYWKTIVSPVARTVRLTPPVSVNFTALLSRFDSTWVRRTGSPR